MWAIRKARIIPDESVVAPDAKLQGHLLREEGFGIAKRSIQYGLLPPWGFSPRWCGRRRILLVVGAAYSKASHGVKRLC
jgi:hypothetical protein